MRRNLIIFGLVCFVVSLCLQGCESDKTYAKDLKKEKKAIDDYIARNNINILHQAPADGVWGEKDYLQIGDYCYFHLSKHGDTDQDSLVYKDIVLLRYKQYTLDTYPQIIKDCWTTNEAADPVQFQYGVSSSEVISGWLLALPYLKYNAAEGRLICPSKLGTSSAIKSVTPYGYDMKIQIRKF